MSEETNQNVKKSKCATLVVLVVLSLIFSIASLATSLFILSNIQMPKKPIVISKQYDKGKTLQKAFDTKKPVVVFFYTDWCGFCQRFAPTYDKLAKVKEIKNNFAVAYVNCEDSNNAKLMEEYKIQGFPTVYVIDKNKNKTQIENGALFGDDAVKTISEKILEIIK